MDIKKSLELKKKIAKKRPNFIKQDAHKKGKLAQNWRKPRGMHSKIRLKLRGYRVPVSRGYRSPAVVRYLDKRGLLPVAISTIEQLSKIKVSEQSVIISKVGKKQKLELLKKAKEMKVYVLNFKDIDKEIAKIEDTIKARKAERSKNKETKKSKEKDREEKAKKEKESKESIEKKIEESDEEKKERERKEQEKILTKKSS